MNVGLTIKKLRKEKGLTQKELSEMTGLSQGYLCHIENNQREQSIKVLTKIANSLDLPLGYIIFASMEKEDVEATKQRDFDLIFPIMKEMVDKLFIE